MRRLLPLLLALLVAAPLSLAHAQEGDMAYFEEFDGLERIIARSWMAPVTYESTQAETITVGDEGTPPTSVRIVEPSPVATPDREPGVGMLSIFVYLFDSDENAASGFERIDAALLDQHERDPRAPIVDELQLEGLGDQARGYTGDLTTGDVTATYVFATVQDGPFVYSFTGTLVGLDATGFSVDTAESLIAAPMDRMVEQYDQQGNSRGGLWSKLNAVEPQLPEASTVIDLIVYPMEEMATPQPSVFDPPALDLDNPGSIDGLATIDHASFVRPGGATPVAGEGGVFRIDAWVLTFDTTDAAVDAVNPLATALGEPFAITSGRGSVQGHGDKTATTDIREGHISDRSLPNGSGIVSVLQREEVVYAVVVYATDGNPDPVADRVMRGMTGASTVPPQERLPEAGDEALEGLVPVETATPVATPGT